ncbi:MAG: purple acid phosphatase family protein [Myxococcota bacterium]
MKKRVLSVLAARCVPPRALALALAAAALLPAGFAGAQLRSATLAFDPPTDARVVGFHVYVGAASHVYGDYRDDINFIPPPDASGAAHYTLASLEQFSDVYISLKSYDATGTESAFSNEILLKGQPQCLLTGCNDNNPCTVDTCTATGCSFNPAPNVGNTCDDGNAMTFNDMCQTNGACSGTLAQCNADADCPAPADVCAGPQSCVAHKCQAGTSPRPDETACNDGKAATKYDVCRSGVCRGFACGNDSQCSDGAACNGVERCVANSCVAGTPMVCNDGNVCNGTETCVGSSCVAGTALQCPADSGPCFDAFCDPTQGCRVQMHPDGETCTTSSSGSAGQCSSGVCVAQTMSVPPPTDPNSTRDPRPPTVAPSTTCNTSFAPPTDMHQELTADAETSRKIVWSAPLNPMGSMLQYRLESSSMWKSLRAVPEQQMGCAGVYSVTLTGLQPSAHYRYRVSGATPTGRVWTGGYLLTPGPSSPTPKFKFAFFAENGVQGTPESMQAEMLLEQIRKGRFPLVLGGGGYTLSNEAIAAGLATNAAQAVALWKDQASLVTSNSIFAPVLSTSEIDGGTTTERTSDYAEYMPLAGGPQTPFESYSYDFGGTHFLAVHAPDVSTIQPSTTAGAAHLAWIDADLAAARANGTRWIVVYMHADLFSSDKTDASVMTVRNALGAILNKYGVNLVLSGEGDGYERTKGLRGSTMLPMNSVQPNQVTTATDGVVFVHAGSGGRTVFSPWLRPTPPPFTAVRDNTHAVYLQLAVSDSKLTVVAYGFDATGKRIVLDTLTIL